MSIRIVVSDRVRVPVDGFLFDENGKRQNFSFTVTARRMSTDELSDLLADSEKQLTQFLQEIITYWAGVDDEDGTELAYSSDALGRLLAIPGLPNLIFAAWLACVGAKDAKAKN